MITRSDFKRIRRFLDLTQMQMSFATGIGVSRIGAIEQERVAPTPHEEELLRSFLAARLEIALGENAAPPTGLLREKP
jgi:DNA-binding transcriptional regulator YiaG